METERKKALNEHSTEKQVKAQVNKQKIRKVHDEVCNLEINHSVKRY